MVGWDIGGKKKETKKRGTQAKTQNLPLALLCVCVLFVFLLLFFPCFFFLSILI